MPSQNTAHVAAVKRCTPPQGLPPQPAASRAARRARALEYATLLLVEDRLRGKRCARERLKLVEVEAKLETLRGALGIDREGVP